MKKIIFSFFILIVSCLHEFKNFKISFNGTQIILPNENSVEYYELIYGKENVEREYLSSKEYHDYMNFPRRRINNLDIEYKTDVPFKYLSLEELKEEMSRIENKYSHCSKNLIGKSNLDNDIEYMEIKVEGKNNKPAFELIANCHGNEIVGYVLAIQLIDLLCGKYGKNERITKLLENIDVYVIPTMNPDGYSKKQRGNNNGVDLNRNFPDQYRQSSSPIQKETQYIIDFPNGKNIILAAHLHGGALCVSYPYDGTPDGKIHRGKYSTSPDDNLYKYISTVYADLNPGMKNSGEFNGGITNGAYWYTLYGSVQDYQYLHNNIVDTTIEVSNNKKPPEYSLVDFWEENVESLLAYMEITYKMGIKGKITTSEGKPIPNVEIQIHDNSRVIETNTNGEYFRLLPEGQYVISFSHEQYVKREVEIIINEDQELAQTIDLVLFLNGVDFSCFGLEYTSDDVCSKNGVCISKDECDCFEGYEGDDCSDFNCYGINKDNNTVCNGVFSGICRAPNFCLCKNSYFGDDCKDFNCFKKNKNEKKVCNNPNGNCIAPNICECNEGYSGNQCDTYSCFGVDSNNVSVCSNHGECISPDKCQCEYQYKQDDCSEQSYFRTIVNPTSAFVLFSLIIVCFLLAFFIFLVWKLYKNFFLKKSPPPLSHHSLKEGINFLEDDSDEIVNNRRVVFDDEILDDFNEEKELIKYSVNDE